MSIDKTQIVTNLKKVYDPEISVNVYDLGLIYGIEIDDNKRQVTITHTLTSAFCPFADTLIEDIKAAGVVDGVDTVEIVTTFDPPFSMDIVPDETKALLGWG